MVLTVDEYRKKKAYGDISIRSMCLHHLHIYTPSTDNVVSFYTRDRGHLT